jgi:hypothetical protein
MDLVAVHDVRGLPWRPFPIPNSVFLVPAFVLSAQPL